MTMILQTCGVGGGWRERLEAGALGAGAITEPR